MNRRTAILSAAALGAAPHVARAAADPSPQRIARIEHSLRAWDAPADGPTSSLDQRMAVWKAPAATVAFFSDGALAWSRGYGLADVAARRPVTPDTLFQAGSISKPVAAIAALRLVAAGTLDLDADLRARLRGWGVDDHSLAAGDRVTLRQLLSHSAGLNMHGFLGYRTGSRMPTSIETLSGADVSNSTRVAFFQRPGVSFSYSGGGYVAMQQLVQEATGRPFAETVRRLVLVPAGMDASSYDQPLAAVRVAAAAQPYDDKGGLIPGAPLVLPEQTAAGLWTTAPDLVRFGMAIVRAWRGEPGALLPPALAREMLSPQTGGWGLGFMLVGEGRALRFGHGGANIGYRNDFTVYPELGQGVAVMTNGDGGTALAFEIERAIAAEYGWPGYGLHRLSSPPPPPRPVAMTGVRDADLQPYVGDYRLPGGPVIRVRLQAGALHLSPGPGTWLPDDVTLTPEARDRFFTAEPPEPVTFERGPGGVVRKLVMLDTLQAFRA